MKFNPPSLLEQFRNAGATIRAAFTVDIAISFPKTRTKFKAIDVTPRATVPSKQLPRPRTQPPVRRRYILASLDGHQRSNISELFPPEGVADFQFSSWAKDHNR